MEVPVLDGEHVRLEPLSPEHLPHLEAIAFDPTNWKYMPQLVRSKDELQSWAEEGWAGQEAGTTMPWVIIAKFDGVETIAGGTRFLDLDTVNKNVEIGNTWIAAAFRGTRVNTESKYLLLRYAFEQLALERIAFKVHGNNLRSQAAVRALGAFYEGTFRCHLLMPDGSRRDSAWFSILRKEWSEVKETLERRLNSPVAH
jgi:RimJ/RimL family protein N-acetyltransferase